MPIYPLLNQLGRWFESLRSVELSRHYLDFIDEVDKLFENPEGELLEFLKENPELKDKAYATYLLSGICENIVFEAILHTGAVGSQLRKRIKPISDFINT